MHGLPTERIVHRLGDGFGEGHGEGGFGAGVLKGLVGAFVWSALRTLRYEWHTNKGGTAVNVALCTDSVRGVFGGRET